MKINLDIRDQKLTEIISENAAVEQIATGFDFLEGPIWHPKQKSLIFSDIMGNSLYRWTQVDGLTKIRRNSYMANGNTYDQQGRLITCEHATSRVTRTDFANDQPLEVLATHFEGKQLNSPNDVVVKSDGTIYFTDPHSGREAKVGVPREPELPFTGVYRLDPESKELTLLVDDFARPNGLCFSQDETQLFINDTFRQHIRVFDVQPDGTLTNGRLWADLEGDKPGVADGMKIDAVQHLYSCGPGGIHIFTPDAHCLGVIEMPEQTANFVWGDEDLCSLFTTSTTSLYRVRVNIPGLCLV
ncbi:MAG: SMP-30/gluconolactonase/LRE family protein [Chloroflexota bacterium]